MSILIFLAVLFVLVLVHEWGHFITAKKTGMRVDEFGIGFPPKVFGFKWGETTYTLNLFPIGGFVKILGENSEEGEDISATDRARTFGARPKWAQALVLVAGVVMNVVLAFALIVAVQMIGVPTAVDEAAAGPTATLYITQVLPDSPAEAAGLLPQTVVKSITDGTDTLDNPAPSSFSEFVSERPDQSLTVTWSRGDDTDQTATLIPKTSVLESDSEKVAVGVALTLVETTSSSFVTALKEGGIITMTALRDITLGLGALIGGAFTGSADLTQVAGPIGIVGMVGDAAAFGLTSLMMFTAIISLNLAVINLLPFPALDGGRLVMVGIETVTRRPINPVWVGRVNAFGFILLILTMLAVTYNDVLRIL